MDLLDRYVTEIGKGLPRKNRADIETEIRSTLQDMLDERAQRAGRPADDAMVMDLLKEYGSPKKVAASYGATQYLIGPRLFPTFELVVRIVWAVLVGVALFGLGVSIINHTSGPDFISVLGRFAAQLFGGLTGAFGNIALVFAVLERVLPASQVAELQDEDWDPAQLAAEPDPADVKPAEPIFAILFTVIGLVVLNVYPNLVGIGFVSEGRWTIVPALSEAFFRYLPWINLLGLLQIGLNLVMLRAGRRTTALRWAEIVAEIGSILLAGFMLAGPALVDLSADKLANTPLASASRQLAPIFGMLPSMILTIIIIVSAVEVAKSIYRMFSRPAVFQPVK